MGLENVPRCQHVKVNGTQCGSPALRRRRLCFFHQRVQDMRVRVISNESTQGRCIPVLEDANGVQVALMQVMEQLTWGRIDHKTAGLMLYALQTASINLRNTRLEVRDPTDVVIDRDTVRLTCLGGPQWVEEDFDTEDEEEQDQAEDSQAEPVAAAALPPAAPPEVASGARLRPSGAAKVNMDEVRENVKGLIRNWVAETVAGKASRELG